MICPAETPEG
jgi:DNA-directed RNA polymerase II subunit RPB2